MQGKNRSRRGTGHLYQKDDRWYGQWYVRGTRVKRSLGPVRQPGANDGLTKRQAQARMLEAMTETDSAPAPVTERLTVEEVGQRRIRELARKGRKQDTTLANYESEIRCHFVPHFGQAPIAAVSEDDVAGFLDACLNDLSVKTVRNLYVHLNAIFEFAIRKRWCHANPCKLVDKPASVADDDAEIRFLDQAELDALLAAPAPRRHTKRTLERATRARALRDQEQLHWKAIGETLGCSHATAVYLYRATAENAADEDLWQVDLAMYLTAAMTGLRQGELLALRWRDVDWPARKIRVSGPCGPSPSGSRSRSIEYASCRSTPSTRSRQRQRARKRASVQTPGHCARASSRRSNCSAVSALRRARQGSQEGVPRLTR
jgi:integrase